MTMKYGHSDSLDRDVQRNGRAERKNNNNGYSLINIRTIVNFIVPVLLLHICWPWNFDIRVINALSLLYYCIDVNIT